ncbi:MAG: hypothetical protein LW875_07390 [Proteobacteria bacterium]|jgi:hypothetical protein|nr:hypothetical protein [Pseudomonadota bacterium]
MRSLVTLVLFLSFQSVFAAPVFCQNPTVDSVDFVHEHLGLSLSKSSPLELDYDTEGTPSLMVDGVQINMSQLLQADPEDWQGRKVALWVSETSGQVLELVVSAPQSTVEINWLRQDQRVSLLKYSGCFQQ